jgi:shikimate kinase
VANTILIGFMGVGKGSIAREIAKMTKRVVLDTDDVVESMENRSVKKIFETEGEEYFRDLEARVAKWLEKSVEDTLISTGGGFFKVKNISKIGKVILLDAPFEKIMERILSHPKAEQKIRKRPLLQDQEKAKTLYIQRLKEYKKVADIVVDVSDKSVEDIALEIIKKAKL